MYFNHLQHPEQQQQQQLQHNGGATRSPDDEPGTTVHPTLATEEDTDLEKDTVPTTDAITEQTFLAKMIEGPIGDGLVSSHIRINALAFDYVCSIILFVRDV